MPEHDHDYDDDDYDDDEEGEDDNYDDYDADKLDALNVQGGSEVSLNIAWWNTLAKEKTLGGNNMNWHRTYCSVRFQVDKAPKKRPKKGQKETDGWFGHEIKPENRPPRPKSLPRPHPDSALPPIIRPANITAAQISEVH